MHHILLVGCGSEIGAMLVGMNDPARDGFAITAVLTNPIDGDPKHPELDGLDSLYARVVLEQPHLLDEVVIDRLGRRLVVRGNSIAVWWGDARTFDLRSFGQRFDICILATSKKHIGDDAIIRRFRDVADVVVGVAEAKQLAACYANLIGAPERFLPNQPRPVGNERVLALGSCQSNGWHAQLRALLDLTEREHFTAFDLCAAELDIVHPDTPTGRLGTKSVEARSQDPRDNFRPSFSQAEMSMNLLFPSSANVNTIALRTLTMPPGYQISRFFFRYETADGHRITRDDVVRSFRATASALPDTLRIADIPLGSRGFEHCEATAIVLSGPHFLLLRENPFRMCDPRDIVVELIVQAYVHNVRGYCRSVLNTIRHLLSSPNPKAFFAPTAAGATPAHAHASAIVRAIA